MGLLDFLLGRPLKSSDERHERIGPGLGLPLLGLDAVSSAAYGPEALLTVMLPLGVVALRYVLPLTLAILAVLAAVALSYRQTIAAYPNGGGSYTVAKENIGRTGSVVAAAALGLDYLLNVAVGISAGVGAAVSAIPSLLPHTLALCLALLCLLTLANLRGVRASGGIFAAPAYLFIGSLGLVIVLALGRVVLAHGHAGSPVVAPPAPLAATAAVTPWLLLRAFANGTTAMTGVEAVSNGVPLFREPRVAMARRTLAAIVLILMGLLAGVALSCRAYGIVPTPPAQVGYQSLLSLLAGAVLGHGLAYGVCMASTVTVLALSANTSFADFPRVAHLLANDGFLPEPFEHRGRRLVFSYGILLLAGLSGALLVVFDGITDRLIPLFAVGALLAFTMSQAGMVVHWRRRNVHDARMWLNAIGASVTGVTVVIVIVSKFVEGAWVSVIVLLALMAILARLRVRHDRLARAVGSDAPLALGPSRPPLVIAPIREWNAVTRRGLRFALGISPDVIAVQVLTDDRPEDDLSSRWRELVEEPAERAGLPPPKLVVLSSDYRRLFDPLLRYVTDLAKAEQERQVAVLVPELVTRRWLHALFPVDFGTVLKALLLLRGGPPVLVISAPCHARPVPGLSEPRLSRP